jgi:hypothetical protein
MSDMDPTPEQRALARAIVAELGRKGGATKSPARAAASRRNAKLATAARKAKAAARRAS